MLKWFGLRCRHQQSDHLNTEQDRPGIATLGCLTYRCKQELVITSNGWKIPEGNFGGSSFCFALKTELLVQLPGNIQIQVQIWNV